MKSHDGIDAGRRLVQNDEGVLSEKSCAGGDAATLATAGEIKDQSTKIKDQTTNL